MLNFRCHKNLKCSKPPEWFAIQHFAIEYIDVIKRSNHQNVFADLPRESKSSKSNCISFLDADASKGCRTTWEFRALDAFDSQYPGSRVHPSKIAACPTNFIWNLLNAPPTCPASPTFCHAATSRNRLHSYATLAARTPHSHYRRCTSDSSCACTWGCRTAKPRRHARRDCRASWPCIGGT